MILSNKQCLMLVFLFEYNKCGESFYYFYSNNIETCNDLVSTPLFFSLCEKKYVLAFCIVLNKNNTNK